MWFDIGTIYYGGIFLDGKYAKLDIGRIKRFLVEFRLRVDFGFVAVDLR